MLVVRRAAAAILVLLPTPALYAWDEAVHRAVAQVAQERARDGAIRTSRYLMGKEFNLADAAGFSDALVDSRPEVDAWRSITLPPGAKRVELRRDCPVGDCVTVKIREFEGIVRLAVKEKAERQDALRFLINLAADLHQPLNAGFPPDQGGERTVLHDGRELSLHELWDRSLLDGQEADEIAERLRALITEERAAEWAAGTLHDWTWDTHQTAREVAYDGVGVDSPQPVDETYLERAREAADLQLAKAAVRLAALIDRIWP